MTLLHAARLRAPTFIATLTAFALSAALVPAEARAESEPEARSADLIRLEGEDDTVFTVPGHGRFGGTVEVRPGPDGRLVLINELDTDAYVEGLAEVPPSWPLESLKAQAVAARTYAWHSINLGTFRDRGLGFDICATVDCQVFHGREIIESDNGHRWEQAVAESAGEVLTYDDAPILARYFSSSGGHTRNNEHVFGNKRPEGPRPYLEGVEDPHEEISPHHRWSVRMTRDELDHLFAHGVNLHRAVPVASVERVPSDGTRVDQIRAVGEDGTEVEVSASKFRAWISEVGPSILPERFPVRTAEGKPMPDGMPSSRIEFDLDDDTVVITGHGWGHGVGMSQWGARGKAEEGMSYDDILAAYYGGLRPEAHPDLPERVRVGLTWEAREVEIRADGAYTAVAVDEQAERSGGTWNVDADGRSSVGFSGPEVEWEPLATPPAEEAEDEDEAQTVPEVTETPRVPREIEPAERGPTAQPPAHDPTADEEQTSFADRVSSLLRFVPRGLLPWLLED
jgi:stage II sporulation protein D